MIWYSVFVWMDVTFVWNLIGTEQKKCSNLCCSENKIVATGNFLRSNEQAFSFQSRLFLNRQQPKTAIHQKGQKRSMKYEIWNWCVQLIFHLQIWSRRRYSIHVSSNSWKSIEMNFSRIIIMKFYVTIWATHASYN